MQRGDPVEVEKSHKVKLGKNRKLQFFDQNRKNAKVGGGNNTDLTVYPNKIFGIGIKFFLDDKFGWFPS